MDQILSFITWSAFGRIVLAHEALALAYPPRRTCGMWVVCSTIMSPLWGLWYVGGFVLYYYYNIAPLGLVVCGWFVLYYNIVRRGGLVICRWLVLVARDRFWLQLRALQAVLPVNEALQLQALFFNIVGMMGLWIVCSLLAI